MERLKPIFCIDIGSYSIFACIGTYNPVMHVTEVLNVYTFPTESVKSGVIVNIPSFKRLLEKIINTVKEDAEVSRIDDVRIAIRGDHVETITGEGKLSIEEGKAINADDIQRVIDSAKAVPCPIGRKILQATPQDFCIDGQSGIDDPTDMFGTHLSASVHITTVCSSHIDNIAKAFNSIGCECEIIYGLLSLGESIVSKEEKSIGIIVIDFGACTIGVSVYLDNRLVYTVEFPIGSDLITNDISKYFKISFKTAQQLKENKQYVHLGDAEISSDSTSIEVNAIGGRKNVQIVKNQLNAVVRARVEEIFEIIYDYLKQPTNYIEHATLGIILSGGGCKLQGLDAIISRIFEQDRYVQRGYILNLCEYFQSKNIKIPEWLSDTSYLTCLSLLNYNTDCSWKQDHNNSSIRASIKKLWTRFFGHD